MRRFVKRLFCNHKYNIEKWHFTHGPSENDPAYIEVIEVCKLCGKEHLFSVLPGCQFEKYIIHNFKSKQV